MRSTKPFPETVQELMHIEEISGRELHRRAMGHGLNLSVPQSARLLRGASPVLPEHIEAYSAALQVRPETFAEYRLEAMRRLLEPEQVGWGRAIKNLQRLEDADLLEPKRLGPGLRLRAHGAGQAGSA